MTLMMESGATNPVRWEVRKFGEVGSTMDLAAEAAGAGAGAGTIFWAESQTQGRGRLGRSWQAPAGQSLLVTLLLRPEIAVVRDPNLSREIAARVGQAVERVSGVRPAVKHPNDLLVGGRKLAGILCQTSVRGERLEYLLVGIGLNVNVPPEALPLPSATSLLAETGRSHDRDALLAAILTELAALPGLTGD